MLFFDWALQFRIFSTDLTLFVALKRQRWSFFTEIIKISVLVYAFLDLPLKLLIFNCGWLALSNFCLLLR